MIFDQDALETLASAVGQALLARGERLATAESCTGGWLAQAITAIPGSSDWFDRGFVTYANAAKVEMLGVDPATLDRHGAVSEACAREMLAGTLKLSQADWAVSITGIAGPGGGCFDKPVGSVWFAFGGPAAVADATLQRFEGDRRAVRAQAVAFALETLRGKLATPMRA